MFVFMNAYCSEIPIELNKMSNIINFISYYIEISSDNTFIS